MVRISRLTKSSVSALADIRALMSQLRSDRAEHGGKLSDLNEMVKNKNLVIVVAKDGNRIVGVGSLYSLTKVGKKIGYVEDVVVNEEYRGQGLGKRIMNEIIATARKKKLQNLFLTSKPARVAANALYQKLGFEIVKTNPYRLTI